MTVGNLPGELVSWRNGHLGRVRLGGPDKWGEMLAGPAPAGPWYMPGSCWVSNFQVICPSNPSWLRPPDVGFTPPSSPPTRPRNDRNVFSRLTSNQSQGSALDK